MVIVAIAKPRGAVRCHKANRPHQKSRRLAGGRAVFGPLSLGRTSTIRCRQALRPKLILDAPTGEAERRVRCSPRGPWAASCQHVYVTLRQRQRGVNVSKRPLVLHFPCGRDEPGHRSAVKGAGEADATYADRLKLRDGE